jgi:hypothetical protein
LYFILRFITSASFMGFIKDSKMSVSQYLKTADKDLTVTEFKRCALA